MQQLNSKSVFKPYDVVSNIQIETLQIMQNPNPNDSLHSMIYTIYGFHTIHVCRMR